MKDDVKKYVAKLVLEATMERASAYAFSEAIAKLILEGWKIDPNGIVKNEDKLIVVLKRVI